MTLDDLPGNDRLQELSRDMEKEILVLEESDLELFWKGDFFEKVKQRFQEMGKTFRAQLENF
jgi:hypothetical protein